MYAQDNGPLMALAAALAGKGAQGLPPGALGRYDNGPAPIVGPGPQDGTIDYMHPPIRPHQMQLPMPGGGMQASDHRFIGNSQMSPLPNFHPGALPPEMLKRLAAIMAGQAHAQQFAGRFPRR
ncbi:MAG TPA: hypothetical protein VIY48_20865 [Candidatus Paceibacterota bacterium]